MSAEVAESPTEQVTKRPKIVHAYCQQCATRRAVCGYVRKTPRVPGRPAPKSRERCVVCVDLFNRPYLCPDCGFLSNRPAA